MCVCVCVKHTIFYRREGRKDGSTEGRKEGREISDLEKNVLLNIGFGEQIFAYKYRICRTAC